VTVELQQKVFGTTASGISTHLYTFTHDSGLSFSVTNFGWIITKTALLKISYWVTTL